MNNPLFLSLHHYEPASEVNGPGQRAVVWLQGCNLGCPECYNPQTHSISQGKIVSVDELAAQILAEKLNIEGITLSGGEPLQQALPLLDLLVRLRQQSNLSVVLFTGYDWEEIQKNEVYCGVLKYLDVVIAGRYIHAQKVSRNLTGSSNKTFHFLTQRYVLDDFQNIPEVEIVIDGNEIRFTGIDTLIW